MTTSAESPAAFYPSYSATDCPSSARRQVKHTPGLHKRTGHLPSWPAPLRPFVIFLGRLFCVPLLHPSIVTTSHLPIDYLDRNCHLARLDVFLRPAEVVFPQFRTADHPSCIILVQTAAYTLGSIWQSFTVTKAREHLQHQHKYAIHFIRIHSP